MKNKNLRTLTLGYVFSGGVFMGSSGSILLEIAKGGIHTEVTSIAVGYILLNTIGVVVISLAFLLGLEYVD